MHIVVADQLPTSALALLSKTPGWTVDAQTGRKPDVVTETINGEPAGTSESAKVLLDAGFRREGLALRYYASIS